MEIADKIKEINKLGNWKINPYKKGDEIKYSANEVIEAYFSGKNAQKREDEQVLFEKFAENIEKATKNAESLFTYIKQQGFECNSIYLRIKDIYNFITLFVVDENDFCSENFKKVYEESIKIKKKLNNSNTFDFSIFFTPRNKHLSIESLRADGYLMSYHGDK